MKMDKCAAYEIQQSQKTSKYKDTSAKCDLTPMLNWGEPDRAPYWSNGVPRDLSIYRTSFRK